MDGITVPFRPESELCKILSTEGTRLSSRDGKSYLPSQPSIALDEREVLPFVTEDLTTPLLNQMSDWLWLVATPKSRHISALHAQIVRGRNIVLTEDPELHLVWMSNKVFIKPMPTYLMSFAFWSYFFLPDRKLYAEEKELRLRLLQGSLGFVRSYMHLIRHESDLRIALKEHLLPQDIDFETWTTFTQDFKYIEDWQVSGRYHYGDLRLTRLNFWAKPILRRLYFRKAAWNYTEHFARYITPLLFIFTTWSVVLGCMQVGIQSRPEWTKFTDVSAWFCVVSLIAIVAVIAFLLGMFSVLAGREIVYAFGKQIRKDVGNKTQSIPAQARESKALRLGKGAY